MCLSHSRECLSDKMPTTAKKVAAAKAPSKRRAPTQKKPAAMAAKRFLDEQQKMKEFEEATLGLNAPEWGFFWSFTETKENPEGWPETEKCKTKLQNGDCLTKGFW